MLSASYHNYQQACFLKLINKSLSIIDDFRDLGIITDFTLQRDLHLSMLLKDHRK